MASGLMHEAVCSVCNRHTGYSAASEPSFVCSKCVVPRSASSSTAKHLKATIASHKAAPRKTSLVTDFMPSGRSGLYIYAVVVKQHPDKVKIGMTRKWVNRRRSYANWDLSPGDAILEERVFRISEEFVDLERLEAHILQTFEARRAFGAEWFHETLDEACRHIDRIMCANGIVYDL